MPVLDTIIALVLVDRIEGFLNNVKHLVRVPLTGFPRYVRVIRKRNDLKKLYFIIPIICIDWVKNCNVTLTTVSNNILFMNWN